MELRQLRYFVVLAEELHFGRAASRIPLAQPALSQQIQKLERELGAPLFDRGRRVELTEVGHVFLTQARATLDRADQALAAVRDLARGITGELRVGLFANGAAELNRPILQAFTAAHPGVRLTVVELDFTQQVSEVAQGRVDAAIVRPPLPDDRLELTTLLDEPRVAMVPERHPLAEADEIDVAALLDEPFIAAHLSSSREWRDYWLANDYRGGMAPNVGADDLSTMGEMMAAVAFGGHVTTTAASVERQYPNWGVRYVPLRDVAGSPIAVATRRDGHAPLAAAFREVAQRVATELVGLVPGARPPGDGTATGAPRCGRGWTP